MAQEEDVDIQGWGKGGGKGGWGKGGGKGGWGKGGGRGGWGGGEAEENEARP